MLFGKKRAIGLDLGASYLKIAQINESRGGYELSLFSLLPMPPDVITDGIVSDKYCLVESLKELMKVSGATTDNAVIGISGHSSVIIKRVSLPTMTEAELQLSIHYEAEQYIPFNIDEVNVDFQIIGPKHDTVGQMDVLIVAVKKKVISDYIDAVSEAGLNPVIVDVEAFALSNMHEVNYPRSEKKNIALVNIGTTRTNIVVLQDGMLVFTRDSHIGSSHHIAELRKVFNVGRGDAEKLKRGMVLPGVPPESVQMVMHNISDEIILDIYKSFEYFRSSVSDIEIHEVILSGGAALIQGFADLMAERLHLPVTIADPFSNIKLSSRLDADFIKDIAPLAAVVVGLALRRPGDRR